MRAKQGRGKLSSRKYAPPQTTNPDKNRQQWNESAATARAIEARERIEKKRRELRAQEADS